MGKIYYHIVCIGKKRYKIGCGNAWGFRIQKRYQVAYNFYGSYKFYGTRLREKHKPKAFIPDTYIPPLYGSLIPCGVIEKTGDQKK